MKDVEESIEDVLDKCGPLYIDEIEMRIPHRRSSSKVYRTLKNGNFHRRQDGRWQKI